MDSRIVCWFSCGAASAVAAYLVTKKYPRDSVIVYCDTMRDEHSDNQRFFDDVEEWIGQDIRRISSDTFTQVDEVFKKTRYMAGIRGARCTVEMKKIPRFKFERGDDTHVFGFTFDEQPRINRFVNNNPELKCQHILCDEGITKSDCFKILLERGIVLPTMYSLGYKNNNCIGCVKATSAKYWNMIRRDFPDVFEKRAQRSRELNVRLTRQRGVRVFLDDLDPGYLVGEIENISCGPDCAGENV